MRTFETGATRDTDTNKNDYEGFLSPLVIQRYGDYMHRNRKQADGNLRDSDNWQKGIPKTAYIKSLWRHFLDLWHLHRGHRRGDVDIQEALCACLFNVMGYLHEELKSYCVCKDERAGKVIDTNEKWECLVCHKEIK